MAARSTVAHRTETLPRRSRRRLILGAVSVVAAATALSVYLWTGRAPSPTPIAGPPASYHIVYRVTDGGSVTTESVWVRRPFESVQVDSLGTAPYLTLVDRLGSQVTEARAAEPFVERVPAAAAQADVRPDVVVQPALERGLLELIGQASVAGRTCTIYRSASSLRAGILAPLSTGGSYTDTCIGPDGLVLRETTYQTGRPSSDRVAVRIAEGPSSVRGADFGLTGSPTPVEQGGGAFSPVTLSSRSPGLNWTPNYLPPGFREVGRYAVIPPQPQVFGQIDNRGADSGGLPGSTVTEIDDVWVRGADVIVMEQGQTLDGSRFSPPTGAETVQLGLLGEGQLQFSGTGPVLTVEPASGRHFIRLSATLDPATVLRIARSIVSAQPGTLTTIPQAAP
jgi:hypothetical protein